MLLDQSTFEKKMSPYLGNNYQKDATGNYIDPNWKLAWLTHYLTISDLKYIISVHQDAKANGSSFLHVAYDSKSDEYQYKLMTKNEVKVT